jgi:hypothetical protein
MEDTSFTRYLLRSLLCRPPNLDSNPAKEAIIYAHPPDLSRRARHYIEGMKMLNNRFLTRSGSYYEASGLTLSMAGKNMRDESRAVRRFAIMRELTRRRCGIEGGLLRLWVYLVSQQGNPRTQSLLRPLRNISFP